jgi:glucose-6-phosphate-specific signal transduction histidine kinase
MEAAMRSPEGRVGMGGGDDRLETGVVAGVGGFDPNHAKPGVGTTSMRDRLGAVGGEVTIVSSPGRGMRVIGRIPVARLE